MNMNFGSNKTPVKVIKEDAFGGTCFIDIYSGVSSKWYKKNGKNLRNSKILIKVFIAYVIVMLTLINMVLNVEDH